MVKKKIVKKVTPNVSFKEDLDTSKVMIQFDNDSPQHLMDMMEGKSKISFELSNTKFSSIEFTDEKTNKKFKIFIKE